MGANRIRAQILGKTGQNRHEPGQDHSDNKQDRPQSDAGLAFMPGEERGAAGIKVAAPIASSSLNC
jgi:hypothetical protein